MSLEKLVFKILLLLNNILCFIFIKTITAASYCEILNRLREALAEKRPPKNDVILLHDNAKHHVAAAEIGRAHV